MIRHILLFVFLTASVFKLFAQEPVRFKLQPGTSEKKEVQIVQPYSDGLDDFPLFLTMEWVVDGGKNNIVMTFDRTNSEGEGLLLSFPLMKNAMLLSDVKACNSLSKRIWRGKGARSVRQMDYFLQSDDIEKQYSDCYRYVAANNEEEFDLGNIGEKESVFFSLINLYVMREEKRPWYYLSKRDMKLEFRAEPIDVEIILERPPADPCELESNIGLLKEAERRVAELESIKEEAEEVIRTNRNCSSLLKAIFEDVEENFPLDQPEWDSSECNKVKGAYSNYKKVRINILSQQCRSVATGGGSSSSATTRCPDLKKINQQLMNLQMEIYAKKKDGKSPEKERTSFLSIKNDTDKKITSSCDKDLLDSYRSFCTYIEDALNN